MGFFAEFHTWLNAILTGYIGATTARMAAALEPFIVTLGVLYVMVWGYLQLFGKIEELFLEGVKRLLMLGMILGTALHLWLYNSIIVDTVFDAPTQLAAAVIGAPDSVSIVDQILCSGDRIASLLIEKGGLFGGDFAFYLAGIGVYLVVGLTAIYTIFLLSLS